ncbi:MAG TPA: saccharopine dehydrogenase NADP-binding domain-containing protein [Thermoanaerobaculia bacterium]|nr:saccharopine dehydrogenase NADP-binding domain-containing protein [Thermoanaerobaculia bacterium]
MADMSETQDTSTPSPGEGGRGGGRGAGGEGSWMIYGATGFTGELAAREAVRRGLRPILAGRNAETVGALARELGLEHRAFPLEPAAIAAALAGPPKIAAVLHCAGPFVRTSAAMVRGCLAAGAHYLDITGEIAVFEKVLAQGEAARQAGVALLPGVGFDVVPSDCLAAHLAAALPDASELTLAFYSDRGTVSRGTLKTMIESLPHTGAVRRDGRIVPVPVAWDAREIDFGRGGRRWAMTIPWGDVATAYHSTGIPNIRVYTGTPPRTIRRLRRVAPLVPLAGWPPLKRFLQRQVERRVTGPSPEVQATARVYLWGEARNAAGRSVTARLETPEAYAFTAVSAVEAAFRAAAGRVSPGAWTPSRAFGKDFVTELPGAVLVSPDGG